MTSNTKIFLGLMAPLVAGAIFTSGMALQEQRDIAAQEDAWRGLMVVNSGGTLIANPAAMDPYELADAKIINPAAEITICTDLSGETYVNPKPGECEQFKEIQHHNRAS